MSRMRKLRLRKGSGPQGLLPELIWYLATLQTWARFWDTVGLEFTVTVNIAEKKRQLVIECEDTGSGTT